MARISATPVSTPTPPIEPAPSEPKSSSASIGDAGGPLLVPPVLAAIRNDEVAARVKMERSVSQEIRDERADLKQAAEQTSNVVVDVALDGRIRWASPSWAEVFGTPLETLAGTRLVDYMILDDDDEEEDGNAAKPPQVESASRLTFLGKDPLPRIREAAVREDPFAMAMESMKQDDSRSQIVRARIRLGPTSIFRRDAERFALQREAEGFDPDMDAENPPNLQDPNLSILMEGQGIMVADRTNEDSTHTMWMLQPYSKPREITIDLPALLVDTLGVGAEVLANYLTALADVGTTDAATHPPPLPILCRICERQITPWWFEKHSDLCLQEHRAESEVQLAHEALTDHRTAIVKVLDALEARQTRPTSVDAVPSPPAAAEYKGLLIGQSPSATSSAPGSASSSGRATPPTPPRSRDASASSFPHLRPRSFAVRRPLYRIVELVLDLCDTALEIKTPALQDRHTLTAEGNFRSSTPGSESRISQVLAWQTPGSSSLESEEGLAALTADTEAAAHRKVEAVLRHRRIIEYAERIRIEFHILVQDCIEAAMRKAASIREGRLSDSSSDEEQLASINDTEDDADTPAPQNTTFFHRDGRNSASPSVSSMSAALRHASDATSPDLDRRRSSIAISTGSNSPIDCVTPRSSAFAPSAGMGRAPSMHKRTSLYGPAGGSDAGGDSDGSLSSSILSAGTHRRTTSPGHELASAAASIGRSRSSRDRKRHSLKLPGVSASPHRQQSPARVTGGPASPLRLSKGRVPSVPGLEGVPSPITSPLMSSHEPGSPHEHRRQSSSVLSSADLLKGPPSPRLSAALNAPVQRAVPPSIRDFEIIKPISKGAFGSVYLSKKKTTGDYYAIKVLKKADMVAKNQVTNVKAERAIMMWQGESDFVAKLYWTFSSKDYLYLVMEYLNGGDCASLIKILGGLSEDWAKKYLAEVILGVEHLHSRGIVHRDLKPDNLLIDQKGHLKLTDFGLSRMGLIGRQKRLQKGGPQSNPPPDLLKTGPFVRPPSIASSRSTSFDFQNLSATGSNHSGQSPGATPLITPEMGAAHGQPSYFNLNRDSMHSRRASGYRSDSGSSDTFMMFKQLSLDDTGARGAPIEEETRSEGESPEAYPLQPTPSVSSTTGAPPGSSTPPQSGMMPPALALFDPEDQNRRFVGTPDYLAPETIRGLGQDETSDWWSIGCILFEYLYGFPPFHANTPEKVFENILARHIEWPSDEECYVSPEAHDLMSRLMTLDPKARLGANAGEKYTSGGEEIRHHPWFEGIHWETLLQDEAQFVPNPENPEDTEYFDPRGATLNTFAEELEDQVGSPPPPLSGADYGERPHDALSGLRKQVNSVKRGLMPLHIPAHVRENRSRRPSEPTTEDDFGAFAFKNLPVLEKANKDVIQKLRLEALKEQNKSATSVSATSSPAVAPSPAPSMDGSPLLPSPLKRTLSTHKHNTQRSASPSGLGQMSASPNRLSQPTSPLLVQFSAGPHHERRKTSSASSTSYQSTGSSLQPASIFDPPRLPASLSSTSSTSSPIKTNRISAPTQPVLSPEKAFVSHRLSAGPFPTSRARAQTLGSQEVEGAVKPGYHHVKRRSQVFDVSPSSSDNEDTRAKALLRVQRRRQSSRRMSQYSFADGPCFRPLDVLICEDHPVSRLVMERLFEKLRCRTITVTSGPDAVRFATSEVQFDIIMMEVKLPQLTGTDVARMIRNTKNINQSTPIVAVTGYLKELPQNHHFDSLVEKPPTLEKLTEVLANLCQWKPPPADWHPGPQLLAHTPSGLRQEARLSDDRPGANSPPHGPFGHHLQGSFPSSSHEDSIASSALYGERDAHDESQARLHDAGSPSVMPRLGTADMSEPSDLDWGAAHGLGIIEDPNPLESNTFTHPGLPHLLHFNSAPPLLGLIMPSPRKTRLSENIPSPHKSRSSEAMRAKREEMERRRHDSAESGGDDEDEELSRVHGLPHGHGISQTSSERGNSQASSDRDHSHSRRLSHGRSLPDREGSRARRLTLGHAVPEYDTVNLGNATTATGMPGTGNIGTAASASGTRARRNSSPRSPQLSRNRHSKLSQQMLRTNSRGSVVSGSDEYLPLSPSQDDVTDLSPSLSGGSPLPDTHSASMHTSPLTMPLSTATSARLPTPSSGYSAPTSIDPVNISGIPAPLAPSSLLHLNSPLPPMPRSPQIPHAPTLSPSPVLAPAPAREDLPSIATVAGIDPPASSNNTQSATVPGTRPFDGGDEGALGTDKGSSSAPASATATTSTMSMTSTPAATDTTTTTTTGNGPGAATALDPPILFPKEAAGDRVKEVIDVEATPRPAASPAPVVSHSPSRRLKRLEKQFERLDLDS